jgi:hypothetical protein
VQGAAAIEPIANVVEGAVTRRRIIFFITAYVDEAAMLDQS